MLFSNFKLRLNYLEQYNTYLHNTYCLIVTNSRRRVIRTIPICIPSNKNVIIIFNLILQFLLFTRFEVHEFSHIIK